MCRMVSGFEWVSKDVPCHEATDKDDSVFML